MSSYKKFVNSNLFFFVIGLFLLSKKKLELHKYSNFSDKFYFNFIVNIKYKSKKNVKN